MSSFVTTHKAQDITSDTSPVVYWPAHHPHAVIGERGDGEAGDQRERVEGGDEHLAQALVPLVVRVLPTQRYDTVHGDGDGHVEDVRAGQRADEELQGLPLLLLGADTEDAPSVGQDGHARANQPSQRVGIDDVILHGGYLIHHVGAGQGGAWGAGWSCWQEQVHARRRRRWRWWWWWAGGGPGLQTRQASYLGGRTLSMGWTQQAKGMVVVQHGGTLEGANGKARPRQLQAWSWKRRETKKEKEVGDGKERMERKLY